MLDAAAQRRRARYHGCYRPAYKQARVLAILNQAEQAAVCTNCHLARCVGPVKRKCPLVAAAQQKERARHRARYRNKTRESDE